MNHSRAAATTPPQDRGDGLLEGGRPARRSRRLCCGARPRTRWADQEGAGLVDLAGAVPVAVEVLGSLGADHNRAQEGQVELVAAVVKPGRTGQ